MQRGWPTVRILTAGQAHTPYTQDVHTGPNNPGGNQAPKPARQERIPTGANELYLALTQAAAPAHPYPPGLMEDDLHIPGQGHLVSTKDTTPLPRGMDSARIELRYGINPAMPDIPVALYTATVRTLDPSNGQSTLTTWNVTLIPMSPDWVASTVTSSTPGAGTINYDGQADATDRLLRSWVPEVQQIADLAQAAQSP